MADINLKRVPIIGDDLYQVGQVYDIIATPCATELWISVFAFFQYTPYAVWSVLKPDAFDIVTERFGRPHKKKRKHRMHVRDKSRGNVVLLNRPQWAIFRIGAALERVGWYLQIVDATTDLLVNWTSTTWVLSGCQIPGAPYVQVKSTTGSWGAFAVDWAIAGFQTVGAFGYNNTAATLNKNSFGPFVLMVTLKFKPGSGTGAKANITAARARFSGISAPSFDVPMDINNLGGGFATCTLVYRIFHPGAFRYSISFRGLKSFGTLALESMEASLSGIEPDGIDSDP